VTAHVTAVLPVMLAVGSSIPGMPMRRYALLLCLSLGIMGVITPYGAGPSPVYYGSGYLPSSDYWRLGTIFGAARSTGQCNTCSVRSSRRKLRSSCVQTRGERHGLQACDCGRTSAHLSLA